MADGYDAYGSEAAQWQAVGQVAAATIGSIGAADLNKKNRKFAAEQATIAYERQQEMLASQQQYGLDMWNKQNEYNSFANQKKLMEEGGINPAVMYGFNGGGSADIATSNSPADSPGAPGVSPAATPQTSNPMSHMSALGSVVPNMVNMLSSFKDIEIKDAQRDNIVADTVSKSTANRYAGEFYGQRNSLQALEAVASQLGIDKSKLDFDMLQKRHAAYTRGTDGFVPGFIQEQRMMQYESQLKFGAIQLQGEQGKLLAAEQRLAYAQATKNIAEAKAAQQSITESNKRIEEITQRIVNLGEENYGQWLENEFYLPQFFGDHPVAAGGTGLGYRFLKSDNQDLRDRYDNRNNTRTRY